MGKLFVIDGTDGSGKQTQLTELEKRFQKENIEYKKVSFPNYDSPSSSLVKMYLNGEFGENAKDVSPYVASTFYAVDRFATYKKEIEEYYNNGGIVLADRYTTANMIHQAGKIQDKEEREKFLNWVTDFEFNMFALPTPTKVIFLKVSPEETEILMKDRTNKITNKETKDIHERDKNHLIDAYNAACEVAKKYNWYTINCMKDNQMRTIEDIHEEIFEQVIKEL